MSENRRRGADCGHDDPLLHLQPMQLLQERRLLVNISTMRTTVTSQLWRGM